MEDRALLILRRCEADLKELLQRAAEQGNYDQVVAIGGWARNVAALVQHAVEMQSSTSGRSTVMMATSDGGLQDVGPAESHSRAEHVRAARRNRSSTYPRFARTGDQLIKIGWSKKNKKEYEHKCPKHVADLLRAALLASQADSRAISTDELFPLEDEEGNDIPDYQAYLCLAWFRAEKLVVQDGRQGYRVTNRQHLAAALPAKWEALPRA